MKYAGTVITADSTDLSLCAIEHKWERIFDDSSIALYFFSPSFTVGISRLESINNSPKSIFNASSEFKPISLFMDDIELL